MKKQRGQTSSEMLILVALVAVATIGVVGVFGDNIRGLSSASSEALAGKKDVTPDTSLVTLDSHRTLANFGENEAAAGSFDRNNPDSFGQSPIGIVGPRAPGPGKFGVAAGSIGLAGFNGSLSVAVAPP